MKLLVVSQYFWPESFIINDLARTLVEQGHEVAVLTGAPNYPEGKTYSGYAADRCATEVYNGNIPVFRVPLRPRGNGGARNLFMNYLSFAINGVRYGNKLIGEGKYDAILVFAPSPIISAVPGVWLKWRRKTPLAIWVQDLWPESLSATGFVRNRLVLKAVGVAVRLIYAGADRLLAQSRAFVAPIARFANPRKIVYYPNSYAVPVPAPDAIGAQLPAGLPALMASRFCAVFAGNIGTAQAIETIVDAARKLRHLPDCHIVIAGGGSRFDWLKQLKDAGDIPNVTLTGRLPAQAMGELFHRAGCLLVTLKRKEIFAYTIPSKMQAYLSAGRPVVAALDGEGARMIEEAGAGLVCPAEDAGQLAERIAQLFAMSPQARDEMGARGQAYFMQHFEMQGQARELTRLLTEMGDKARGGAVP